MIIDGASVGHTGNLGAYLARQGSNQKAELVEVVGLASDNVKDALWEMEAIAQGSKCENHLYHSSINPKAHEHLTPEQWQRAVELLEKEQGFEGLPRVVVAHVNEKGREHRHIVWERVDPETMKARSDSWDYPKHEKAAREMEREFGLDRVQGPWVERNGEKVKRAFDRGECEQSKRLKVNLNIVRADATATFEATENGQDYIKEIEKLGYIVSKGDKRDFVLIDEKGGIHNLAKRIEGAKAAEIRERFKDVDREKLPSVEEARERQAERARVKTEAMNKALEDVKPFKDKQAKEREQKAFERATKETTKPAAPTATKQAERAAVNAVHSTAKAGFVGLNAAFKALDSALDLLAGPAPKKEQPAPTPTSEMREREQQRKTLDTLEDLYNLGRKSDEERQKEREQQRTQSGRDRERER